MASLPTRCHAAAVGFSMDSSMDISVDKDSERLKPYFFGSNASTAASTFCYSRDRSPPSRMESKDSTTPKSVQNNGYPFLADTDQSEPTSTESEQISCCEAGETPLKVNFDLEECEAIGPVLEDECASYDELFQEDSECIGASNASLTRAALQDHQRVRVFERMLSGEITREGRRDNEFGRQFQISSLPALVKTPRVMDLSPWLDNWSDVSSESSESHDELLSSEDDALFEEDVASPRVLDADSMQPMRS